MKVILGKTCLGIKDCLYNKMFGKTPNTYVGGFYCE